LLDTPARGQVARENSPLCRDDELRRYGKEGAVGQVPVD